MASPFLAPPQKLRGGAPTKRQVVGRVASPHLEGGQVAVLRLHAASAGRATKAPYSYPGGVYVPPSTKCPTSPRKLPNFLERRHGEVRHSPAQTDQDRRPGGVKPRVQARCTKRP